MAALGVCARPAWLAYRQRAFAPLAGGGHRSACARRDQPHPSLHPVLPSRQLTIAYGRKRKSSSAKNRRKGGGGRAGGGFFDEDDDDDDLMLESWFMFTRMRQMLRIAAAGGVVKRHDLHSWDELRQEFGTMSSDGKHVVFDGTFGLQSPTSSSAASLSSCKPVCVQVKNLLHTCT
jgi:hypothetical protein